MATILLIVVAFIPGPGDTGFARAAAADCSSLQARIVHWEKRRDEFLTRVKEFAVRRDGHNAHADGHNSIKPYVSQGQTNAYNAEAKAGNKAADRINANRDTLLAERDRLNNEGSALEREWEECQDGRRFTNSQIGDAAENHFIAEAKKKGYTTVLTAKNPSGNGVDAFMYNPTTRKYLVTETKANSGKPSKDQLLGPTYALDRLLQAAEGKGRWSNVSPEDKVRAEKALEQLMSGETRPDIRFLVVRYDVKPNPTNPNTLVVLQSAPCKLGQSGRHLRGRGSRRR